MIRKIKVPNELINCVYRNLLTSPKHNVLQFQIQEHAQGTRRRLTPSFLTIILMKLRKESGVQEYQRKRPLIIKESLQLTFLIGLTIHIQKCPNCTRNEPSKQRRSHPANHARRRFLRLNLLQLSKKMTMERSGRKLHLIRTFYHSRRKPKLNLMRCTIKCNV